MAANQRRSNVFQFMVIFLIVYMLTSLSMRFFFPDQYEQQNGNGNGNGTIILKAVDDTVKGQHHPEITIRNTTNEDLVLGDRCPMPPVRVFYGNQEIETAETVLPCEPLLTVPPKETVKVSLAPWKYSLFDQYGNYTVQLPLEDQEVKAEFSYNEVGFITQSFRAFISKPLLNLLIVIASFMPDYSLGWAVIILTLLVKLALFVPTQHALEGQKKMQAVQPKIDALRKKYKSDPQRLNQETLKLWKDEKINPMQSCLPMLLQFPVLIGLFFVIRDGALLELSRHLLYEPHANLGWTFGTDFFGLDLSVPSVYVLPPLLVVTQFIQMKLSFAIAKKKKDSKDKVVDVSSDKNGKKEAPDMMQTQQKVMTYGLPIMIGVFAFQFPAAVSLYWWVSTLFAIGQQMVVNRKHLG